MIIPIGHEDSGTRRRPWVTIAVMVVCMAAWIATLHAFSQLEPLPPAHYREQARLYWEANPYLEIESELAKYMILHDDPDAFSGKEAFTEERWELWLLNKQLRSNARSREQGAVEPSKADLLRQQAELDRLVTFGFYLNPKMIPPEGNGPIGQFGLTPSDPSWYGFFTHVFMHASWAHILGNLFLFFLAAPALEDRWGRPLFALFFISAGVFAGAFHMILSLDSELPLVGASGAISGVLGAFLVLYWKSKIKFAYYFFPPFFGTFLMPAWICLPLWFANEMGSAWLSHSNQIQDNVAYWAHVGGFLFGSLFAVTLRGMRVEERFLERAISQKVIRARSGSMLAAARQALASFDAEQAFLIMQQEVEDQPENLELLLGFLEAAVAFRKPEVAAAPLEAWIRKKASGKQIGEAGQAWAQAVELWPAFDLDPAVLILLVSTLIEQGHETHAGQALRYVISSRHRTLPGSVALRARDLAKGLDPEIELGALRRILAGVSLPEQKRARLEQAALELEGRGVGACRDPLGDEVQRADRAAGGAIPIESSDDEIRVEEARWAEVTTALPPRFGSVKMVEAVPLELQEQHLVIRTGSGRTSPLELSRVQGLAAGIVSDLGAKPVLVVDLLLNWGTVVDDTLQLVRIRSNTFDPTSLFPAAGGGVKAIIELIRSTLARSGADALPSESALLGGAFERFDTLTAYEREVLNVERP